MPAAGPVTTWTRAYLRYTAVPCLEEKDGEFERLHPRDRRGRFRRKPWSVFGRRGGQPAPDLELEAMRQRVAAASTAAPALADQVSGRDENDKAMDAFWEADETGETHPHVEEEWMAERAAVIQKHQVMRALTARLEHVPDEVMIPDEQWQKIEDVRAGRAVWTRMQMQGPTGADPDEEFIHPLTGWTHEVMTPRQWEERVGRGGDLAANTELVESVEELIDWHRSATVARLVTSWAETSNGDSVMAHALQESARRLFGLDQVAEWDAPLPDGFDDELAEHLDRWGGVYEEFLRAMWEHTQEWFAARGIRSLILYRGLAERGENWIGDNAPRVWQFPSRLRPMSSFAVDADIAYEFAEWTPDWAGDGGPGVIDHLLMSGVVPVERIIGCPMTGFGCLGEREMVVLAGPGIWEVRLVGQSWAG